MCVCVFELRCEPSVVVMRKLKLQFLHFSILFFFSSCLATILMYAEIEYVPFERNGAMRANR